MQNMRMGLRLLETLTSALYEDPIVLFREYVQNSVDAFVEVNRDHCILPNSDFWIDINIDTDKKIVIVRDNGFGIPSEKFVEEMNGIGNSKKSQYDQIGFRGIGRLSAMPFCQSLVFKNKVVGANVVQMYSWDGTKYHQLLKSEQDQELHDAIQKITKQWEESYTGDEDDHFFEVEILQYEAEIEELLHSDDFSDRLQLVLPLKYNPIFSKQEVIKQKYEEYMGLTIDSCSFAVNLDGKPLFKPYEDANILESDINFWEIQFKRTDPDIPPDKAGILWFTFDRKVSAVGKSGPLGIFVRSKNMLVGGRFSLADAVTKNSTDYVSTYREIAQTLKGVYGELLLYTPRLDDNARRDWFKIDSSSIELRGIIADFLRRLIAYRYAASKALNNKGNKNLKENFIRTYKELTQGTSKDEYIRDSFDAKEEKKEDNIFTYADDDIPRFSVTYKKFYDQILGYMKSYYIKIDKLEEFIKVRTHIKKSFDEESKR